VHKGSNEKVIAGQVWQIPLKRGVVRYSFPRFTEHEMLLYAHAHDNQPEMFELLSIDMLHVTKPTLLLVVETCVQSPSSKLTNSWLYHKCLIDETLVAVPVSFFDRFELVRSA
jgi:hypothetical protein